MEMSHLYDDSHFSSPTIELDVREQIRTREVNAREERNLARQSKSYERAKDICERNTSWERWKVGQTLHTIWERTPRLERSLVTEKARVDALQRALLGRTHHRSMGVTSDHAHGHARDMPASPPGLARSARRRSHKKKRGKSRQTKHTEEEGRPLNTDFSLNRHLQKQTDFVRRSEHVVKTLARLNWRQETRRREHQKFKEDLIVYSKPVAERARLVLQGRADLDVDSFLKDFENYLITSSGSNNNSSISGHMNSLAVTNTTRHPPEGDQLLSTKNVLKLDSDQEPLSFLPAVVSSTSSSDVVHVSSSKRLDENNNEDDHNVTLRSEDLVDDRVQTDHNIVAGELFNLDMLHGSRLGHAEQGQQISGFAAHQEFHLPSIHGQKSVNSERPMRYTTKFNNDNNNNKYPSNHRSSDGVIGATTSTSSGLSSMFSPSTSVSQVIIEEEEEDSDNTHVTPYYHHSHHHTFNNNNNHNKNAQSLDFQFKEDQNDDNKKKERNYRLACTVGLPQLWKQAMKKQNEKPAVEITPSTLARKHKRRNKSQNFL